MPQGPDPDPDPFLASFLLLGFTLSFFTGEVLSSLMLNYQKPWLIKLNTTQLLSCFSFYTDS